MKYVFSESNNSCISVNDDYDLKDSEVFLSFHEFREMTNNIILEKYIYKLVDGIPQKVKVDPAPLLSKRAYLLSQSDWTELPSALARLGEAKIQAWQEYRQALRDITKQEGFPENVVFPKRPE